jgi:UDP:flavonoid glycosyltransferase YjiC (YdhE family)
VDPGFGNINGPCAVYLGVRVLFAATRGAGHVGPLVPFAHACVRAGHEVIVAAPASAAPVVGRTGLPHRAVGEAPHELVEDVLWARSSSPEDVIRDVFVGLHARTALPGMIEAIADWRPDVIVRESMELASVLTADRLEVPVVRVGIHLDSATDSTGWLEDVAASALGVFADRLREGPLLTRSPGDEEDGVHRFRTNMPRRRSPQFVYVTFGSEAPHSPHFPGVYREAAEELAALDVPVLMTIGDRREPAELGPLPPNVRVERWVAHADVMPRAAAIVSHGGSGSTLTALAAGVPQAFVPLFVDGPANARRVAELGAGILAGDDLAADVRALIDDPRYALKAAAVADEIAALPPVDDAVALIQRSAAGHAIR